MSQDLLAKVDRGRFQEVFIEDLNWLAPDMKQSVTVTDDFGRAVSARNIASYKGLRVWVCDERPGSALEAALDRLIAKTSTDRLVIFDGDQEQVWRWPVRRANDGSVTSRLTSHRHKKGEVDPKFTARLDLIRMPFDVVLDANAVLAKVREAFDTEAQNESKRASKLMANMYTAVEKAYPQTVDPKVRDHEISVTLARILFLMFGDDTEMWETDAFRNLIQHDVLADGSNLAQVLNDLFTFLDTAMPMNVPNGFAGFKYVNGGIFEEKIDLPPLNKDFRTAILEACAVDWSGISPAIFGSMFQSVRDAETRRALGEHYTSEANILKTLNPLFLDELREELLTALGRETTQKRVNSLNRLWDRLADIRFMDPACGCGNFIIVAYRELRALELRVMEALHELEQVAGQETLGGDLVRQIRVTLDHFNGIEIDEWPARIAETAMFMMDRQCDLKLQERFGQAPERLPIQQEAQIVVGNALRQDWRQILAPAPNVIIAGNPPFLGHASRTEAQSQELRDLWDRDDIGRLDYATGWYAQALSFFGESDGRWSFVSTNSVTQGEPVPTLFSKVFAAGWRIRFGHRTFPWQSEAAKAAAVHCVIVGFDRNRSRQAEVFDYDQRGSLTSRSAVRSLNAYLVPGPNVLVEQRRKPISPVVYPFGFGSRPNDGGAFVLDAASLEEALADPTARRFVRPFVGAREIVQGQHRWVLWLRDASAAEITHSPFLRERVAICRSHRLSSKRAATREWADRPHLFDFDSQPSAPYVAVPGVSSENRPYYLAARFDSEVVASNAAFTAIDPDGLLFALVSSGMFAAWQRTVGGRLKSDLRFSNTVVWSNFPVPLLTGSQREGIIEAGLGVVAARGLHPDRSLADLYSPRSMPEDVRRAHQHLDEVVDAAFGSGSTLGTLSERQTVLFQRFAELSHQASA